MKLLGKSRKGEENNEFIERARQIELDFLRFLNVGLDFANKQTDEQSQAVIANYVQSLGDTIKLTYKLLNKPSTVQLMVGLPKVMVLMRRFEKSSEALKRARPNLNGWDEFEVHSDALTKRLTESMDLIARGKIESN